MVLSGVPGHFRKWFAILYSLVKGSLIVFSFGGGDGVCVCVCVCARATRCMSVCVIKQRGKIHLFRNIIFLLPQ